MLPMHYTVASIPALANLSALTETTYTSFPGGSVAPHLNFAQIYRSLLHEQ